MKNMSTFERIFKVFRAQPPSKTPYPPETVERDFKRWQVRVMAGMMGGYALFYFVRKNISMALPGMEEELGYTNTELGLLLTGTSLMYGLGKFLNGILADRANPRFFMAIGLALSALINVAFGLSSAFWLLFLLWVLNGWVQSMGWPPCATLLTSWYEPKRLATWWGVWNASHQIGGALVLIMGGYLASYWGWRSIFFVPALIAFLGCFWIIGMLRDRPEAQGFPSPYALEDATAESSSEIAQESESDSTALDADHEEMAAWTQVRRYILTNPLIWLVSVGNLFVYIVRIGMLDWAPKFLKESRGVNLEEAGWIVAALEIAGILGGLFAGYLADRFFKNRYSVVNSLYMLGLAGGLWFLYASPTQGVYANALILSVVGFLVYGPQMLAAVSAASYAPRHCAAAATGFNGLFGYLGASISGVVTGWCVDHFGWSGGVFFYFSAAILGCLSFILAHLLHVRRHSHQDSSVMEDL